MPDLNLTVCTNDHASLSHASAPPDVLATNQSIKTMSPHAEHECSDNPALDVNIFLVQPEFGQHVLTIEVVEEESSFVG